jgi:NaMN:DMB phosphoribosyltransferase
LTGADVDITPGMVLPLPDDAAAAAARARLAAIDLGINAPTVTALGMLSEAVVYIAAVQGSAYPRPLLSTRVVLLTGAHAGGVVAGPTPDPRNGLPLQHLAINAGAGIVTLEWQPAAAAIEFEDAITPDQMDSALRAGWAEADRAADEGIELLVLAAGGAGATTAAAAVVAAVTGAEPTALIGRVVTPAGYYDDNAWMTRCLALRDALHRVRDRHGDPRTVLAALGGADIAAATGLILGAASRRLPVMIDGPVGAAAALVANDFSTQSRRWVVLPDTGRHMAVRFAAEALELRPWLDLCLDLGEGAAALAALPLLQTALTLAGVGEAVEPTPFSRFDSTGNQIFVGVARAIDPAPVEAEEVLEPGGVSAHAAGADAYVVGDTPSTSHPEPAPDSPASPDSSMPRTATSPDSKSDGASDRAGLAQSAPAKADSTADGRAADRDAATRLTKADARKADASAESKPAETRPEATGTSDASMPRTATSPDSLTPRPATSPDSKQPPTKRTIGSRFKPADDEPTAALPAPPAPPSQRGRPTTPADRARAATTKTAQHKQVPGKVSGKAAPAKSAPVKATAPAKAAPAKATVAKAASVKESSDVAGRGTKESSATEVSTATTDSKATDSKTTDFKTTDTKSTDTTSGVRDVDTQAGASTTADAHQQAGPGDNNTGDNNTGDENTRGKGTGGSDQAPSSRDTAAQGATPKTVGPRAAPPDTATAGTATPEAAAATAKAGTPGAGTSAAAPEAAMARAGALGAGTTGAGTTATGVSGTEGVGGGTPEADSNSADKQPNADKAASNGGIATKDINSGRAEQVEVAAGAGPGSAPRSRKRG